MLVDFARDILARLFYTDMCRDAHGGSMSSAGGVAASSCERTYTPLQIANWFIKYHGSETDLKHMKLQKLVYCAYGWWLAFKETPLTREGPQVWKYGPVFETLYHALRPNESRPIREMQTSNPFSAAETVPQEDEETTALLKWVWNRYGHLSGFALSDMTHQPGTPWHKAAEQHDFVVPRGFEIPKEFIKEEFSRIHKESRSPQ
jgi:uncharacterized phage-associated protein